MTTTANNDSSSSSNPLLTLQSYATSLSAPRIPPYGSIHYDVMLHSASSSSSVFRKRLKQYRETILQTLKLLSSATTSANDVGNDNILHHHYSIHYPQSIQCHDFRDEENGLLLFGGDLEDEQKHDKQQTRMIRHLQKKQEEKMILHHLLRFIDNSINTATNKNTNTMDHPHLLKKSTDPTERYLFSKLISKQRQQYSRANGSTRTLADLMVLPTIPFVAVLNPRAFYRFIQLSSQSSPSLLLSSPYCYKQIRYGTDSEKQTMDIYCNSTNANNSVNSNNTRIILFIHGGAWGSGLPWFYRLVAHPFLNKSKSATDANTSEATAMNYIVAVPGYRTYPDGNIQEQTMDIQLAAMELQKLYPHNAITLMGHSSGAHCSLLVLVDLAIKQQQQIERTDDGTKTGVEFGSLFDSFIGISGPYNISYHFDYESSRGVEEVSPMKPVCGNTRTNFRINSPALRYMDSLQRQHQSQDVTNKNNTTSSSSSDGDSSDSTQNNYNNYNHNIVMSSSLLFPRNMLFVHGIEDETVPFTSTSDAVKVLKSCGVQQCQEIYVDKTAHQGTIMHMMVGGKTQDVVMTWIRQLDNTTDCNASNDYSRPQAAKSNTTASRTTTNSTNGICASNESITPKMYIQSRL